MTIFIVKKKWIEEGKLMVKEGAKLVKEGQFKVKNAVDRNWIEEGKKKIREGKKMIEDGKAKMKEVETKVRDVVDGGLLRRSNKDPSEIPRSFIWSAKSDDASQRQDHGYDAPIGYSVDEAGQAYCEFTCNAPTMRDWAWYDYVEDEYKLEMAKKAKSFKLECNGAARCCREIRVVPQTRTVGARSLQKMAMNNILDSLEELTIDAVEYLPKHIAHEIFELIVNRGLMSFALWKCFLSVLKDEDPKTMSHLHYRQAISTPKIGLSDYTRILYSPNLDYLVHLSITAKFPINAYVKLAELKNLAVLEIVRVDPYRPGVEPDNTDPEPPHLDDRVIRAWSESVVNDGAFPVLRILKLWYHKYVTNVSLEYVAKFPVLGIFDVRGCGCVENVEQRGELKHGWLSTYKADHLSFLEEICVKRLKLIQRASFPDDSSSDNWSEVDGEDTRTTTWGNEAAAVDAATRAFTSGNTSSSFSERRLRSIFLKFQRSPPYPISIDAPVRVVPREEVSETQITNTIVRPPRKQGPVSWDHHDFTAFAKIGELRGDRDLQKAGVKVTNDQTFVQDQLVSPIPMVSVRLGPNIDHLYPCAGDPMSKYFELIARSNNAPASKQTLGQSSRVRPPQIPNKDNDQKTLEKEIFFFALSYYRLTLGKTPSQPPPPLTRTQTIKRKAEKTIRKVKKPKTPGQFSFMPNTPPLSNGAMQNLQGNPSSPVTGLWSQG